MNSSRRLSLYSAALAGLLMLLAGALALTRQFVSQWIGGAAQAAPVAGLIGEGMPWLIIGLLGLAAWAVSWGIANRAARPLTMAGAAERGSSVRKAYLHLGQLAALAAVVSLAWLALRDLTLRVLAGSTDSLRAWLATPLALFAGSIVALLVWGYLRWETVRDGDWGREPGRAANWRRAYVYLAALAGSALAAGGAGELLRTEVTILNGGTGAAAWHARAAASVAALLVGAPLALLAWGRADRQAADAPAAEVNALSRVALRYGGLFFGTVITLLSVGYLLDQIFLLILRRSFGPYWPAALAYLPVALITWLACAGGIRRDGAMGGESAHTGALRRLVRYAIAALALAAFWFGLTEFVRLILSVALRIRPADAATAALWWERFARTAALVLIGAPAWWGHWWSQQARARVPGAAGHAERASALRRAYLYAIVAIGACVALAAVGFGAFLVLNKQAAGAAGLRSGAAAAAAAGAVAALWAIAHALTLRGDDRWLAADSKWQRTDQAAGLEAGEAAAGPSVANAPPPAANRGPRTFSREALPALPEALKTQPWAISHQPSAGIAVIDGADGAVGAALLAALRRAAPQAVLWPMGLNAEAQVAMLNALGEGAPPAAPPDALARAIAILGPSDIVLPGGLDGEVTPELAAALAESPARLLLLPPRDPRLRWVAAPDWPLARWAENAAIEVTDLL